jgi:hypothetical protein
MIYQSESPWVDTDTGGITSLLFSVPNISTPFGELVDDDTTLDVLLVWAEMDPHGLFHDSSALTVTLYEGDAVDVYRITGATQVDDEPFDLDGLIDDVSPFRYGDEVEVPVVNHSGDIGFMPLDM